MRRKTFDVLFEPAAGLTALVKQPSLWRSGYYFTLSVGLFTGVITNTWLLQQTLQFRFAVIAAVVLVTITTLTLYGFLLHGILETFSEVHGDPVGLICLLGYTTLPFLALTPAALLTTRLGMQGLPWLLLVILAGAIWMLFLLVRSLEVVYILDVWRAGTTVLFSLLLLYIVFVLPWQLGITVLLSHF